MARLRKVPPPVVTIDRALATDPAVSPLALAVHAYVESLPEGTDLATPAMLFARFGRFCTPAELDAVIAELTLTEWYGE